MKQFRVMNPTTYAWRTVDEGELMSMMSTATDSLLAQWVPVGGEFTDSDGFQVERDEDVGPGIVDPRLERIATAALQGLLAGPTHGSSIEYAQAAIQYAKALITKLDKQA